MPSWFGRAAVAHSLVSPPLREPIATCTPMSYPSTWALIWQTSLLALYLDYGGEGSRNDAQSDSVLKRMINGTYISVDAKHLARYIEEELFRYNERENTDGLRFVKAVKGAEGKRLTYKELIAK